VLLWFVPLSRVILSSSDVDTPLYPEHVSGSLIVTDVETGIYGPSVRVTVDLDKSSEYLDNCIQFCLLNYTLDQLEQVSNISTLVDDEHLVGRFWHISDPPRRIFLYRMSLVRMRGSYGSKQSISPEYGPFIVS
jgi:hypothetical protein